MQDNKLNPYWNTRVISTIDRLYGLEDSQWLDYVVLEYKFPPSLPEATKDASEMFYHFATRILNDRGINWRYAEL